MHTALQLLTLSKDRPIESQSPRDAVPLASSFLSFLTDPPSTTRKTSESSGTIARNVSIGVRYIVRSWYFFEATSMTIWKFDFGADTGVMSNFAVNASSALSVSWSSASGRIIVLKIASSLLFPNVQDRTILCRLTLGTLRRNFVGSLFGESSRSRIASPLSMCSVSKL